IRHRSFGREREMEALSATRTAAPEPAELIARARAMVPALAARSLEQMKKRSTLPETMASWRYAPCVRPLTENGPRVDHRNPVNRRERTSPNPTKTPIFAGISGATRPLISLFGGLPSFRVLRERLPDHASKKMAVN